MANNKIIFGNEVLLDLTQDTIMAADLAKDVTAHDKSGNQIVGTNTYDADTSDADASAGELLATKTAYVNGVKLTGSMPNRGAISETIDDKDDVITIPNGYHDGSGTVELDATEKAKLISSNILQGVTILGVEGSVQPSSEIEIEPSKNVTPYTTAQTILPSSGYDVMSEVVVAAISKTVTPNAAGGNTVTIGDVAPTS